MKMVPFHSDQGRSCKSPVICLACTVLHATPRFTQSPYQSHCTLVMQWNGWRSESLWSISFLFLPCDAYQHLSLWLEFQFCPSSIFVFEFIFPERRRSLKHLESCFPVNLWPLGLNTPPAWWLGSLLLSSGCSGAPALLSCMQYPTTCALSEAVSNSEYKPWLICFTSCFTWLLSVPNSPMRFTGFHVHGNCFLI